VHYKAIHRFMKVETVTGDVLYNKLTWTDITEYRRRNCII